MAIQKINIGIMENDGLGDYLRNAFDKTNKNFTELDLGKANKSEKGVPNGYASLGSDGLIPPEQMPEITGGGEGQALLLNTFGTIEDNNLAYSISLLDSEGNVISTTEEFTGGSGGGGGTGGGIVFRLKSTTSTNAVLPEGDPFVINYEWSSLDGTDPTGPGLLTVKANNVTLTNTSVAQGTRTFSVPASAMIAGINNITLKVTDSYGNARTITYSTQVVALRISSSYDITTINTGDITFRYTPIGNVNKTIHFELDGVELTPVVTTITNRQLTYNIPAQDHGSHKLRVWMTATVDGTPIESNELQYELISIETGNNTVVIAASLTTATVEQFQTLPIQYVVYNPLSTSTTVQLIVDGVVLQTVVVNRALQTWNYKATEQGTDTLKIKVGAVEKTIVLTVIASSIPVQAETADLELYLTAQNRSNSEVDKAVWNYNDIHCTLSNFNFTSNGWVLDEKGSPVLRVDNGASVTIPFKPFNKDLKSVGKTIEIEFQTQSVANVSAVVMTCLNGGIGFTITPQSSNFSSEQSSIGTRFKEEERIRLAFVITKNADGRLLEIFINGVLSAMEQYPVDDNFLQPSPVNITMGNIDAGIDIYNIRSYNNNLNEFQLLDNYIADLDNLEVKAEVYLENKIYDDFGNLDYNLCNTFLPCLTITGTLPTFKGDKLNRSYEYSNLQDPSKSFTATGVIDVQGTSSQYYPRKNWKIKFANITDNIGNVTSTYKLRANSVPEAQYTFKADFAESSGTHNTGLARFLGDALVELGYKTPPQIANPNVRTTIDGFPCLIFHKLTADSPRVFNGKYNFNNDKTDATFGFAGSGIECWETLNNTSQNILFTGSDFTSTDGSGKLNWLNDFEARYPGSDYQNSTKLRTLSEWVVSTIGNPTKFRDEVASHFNMDFLIYYYVMTEFFGMVDQRGKNMFLTVFPESGGDRWYNIFYDNDTVLGLNNEGALVFPYDIEYHDIINSGYVWNAENSTLWNNVELAFDAEITALYKKLRADGILTYERILQYLDADQSDKWSASIYNEDSTFKYLDPLLETGNASYLYAAQGSREEHRKWWVANRIVYMDGKYQAAGSQTDYITMRVYTPSLPGGGSDFPGSGNVKPNADFTLVPVSGGYTMVKYGSYQIRARLRANSPTIILAPDIIFNDTETIIYGASLMKTLGDLSPKYLGTMDVSKAINLTELIIGRIGIYNGDYSNGNLTHLTLGNNQLLTKLNVAGCWNLKETIDMSQCFALNEVEAKLSGILGVTLPNGGSITKLSLPRVSSIIIKNQIALNNAGLTLEGWENVNTLVIDNTPNINVEPLLVASNNLNRVRFVNISGTSTNADNFYVATIASGVDDNGNTIPEAYISGNWYFDKMYNDDYNDYIVRYPDWHITAGTLTDIVTFENAAIGTVLVNRFDTNGSGNLTLSEVRAITNMSEVFSGGTTYRPDNFDEFRLFTGVVSVGENDLPRVNRISFPLSLKTIENDASINCNSIFNYEQLTSLGDNAFLWNDGGNMVNMSFPNLTYLGSGALINLLLEKLDFTGSIFTTLKSSSINHTSLRSLTLNNTITVMKYNCIDGSRPSEGEYRDGFDLNIPNSVITIEDNALSNAMANVRNLTIGNSVQTIGERAFDINSNSKSYAESIKDVTIPTSVVYIGNINFRAPIKPWSGDTDGTGGYLNFIMESPTPPYIESNAFNGNDGSWQAWIDAESFIYVRDSSVTTYKTATNWSAMADIIKPLSSKP